MEEIQSSHTPTTETIAIPEGKVYKERAIYSGTFLGGPLVAGYMMASNYKVFGESEKAKRAWFWSIIVTALLFGIILFLPDKILDKIPSRLAQLIYAPIAYFLVKRYQEAQITTHVNAGGKKYTWGRTILVSLVGTIFTVLPLFYFAVLTASPVKYDSTKTYIIGSAQNNISYNSYNISTSEVDAIAGVVIKTGYFNSEKAVSLSVRKDNAIYEITAICSDAVKLNPAVLPAYVAWQKQLQDYIYDHKIVLILCIDDFGNEYKRLD